MILLKTGRKDFGSTEAKRPLARALEKLAEGAGVAEAARAGEFSPEELKTHLLSLATSLRNGETTVDGRSIFFVDGASRGNPGPAAAGIVHLSPNGSVTEKALFLGETTNNVAEYVAVELALKEAVSLGLTEVEIRLDSELVYNQLTGNYRIKDKKMVKMFLRVRKLAERIRDLSFRRIPRSENLADRVANLAIDSRPGV